MGTLQQAGSSDRYTLTFQLGNHQASFEIRAGLGAESVRAWCAAGFPMPDAAIMGGTLAPWPVAALPAMAGLDRAIGAGSIVPLGFAAIRTGCADGRVTPGHDAWGPTEAGRWPARANDVDDRRNAGHDART